MDYRRVFFVPTGLASAADPTSSRGELPGPSAPYVYSPEIELAVNVAIVTGRALLVRGSPGSGKSALASDVAWRLGWRFYHHTVTSTTEAADLLWRFDAVRRLADAQADRLAATPHAYVEPGVLWWAIDPDSARCRGLPASARASVAPLDDPCGGRVGATRAVVLVDEIDKADPDVPNNLLEILGARRFRVREIDTVVEATQEPLLVVSTNEERSLPDPFLRRCVVLKLQEPGVDRLVAVARAHFGQGCPDAIVDAAARLVVGLREVATARRLRAPSIAEFLDLLRAAVELGVVETSHPQWAAVVRATLWKSEQPIPEQLE